MTSTNFLHVAQWHMLAGIMPPKPANLDDQLALKLIEEEVEELKVALANNDKVEVADALGDILFVVYGAAYRYGMDANKIFAEVARSNFSKFCLTEQEALDTIATYNKANTDGFADCRKEGDYWIVYRVSDGKLLKNNKWSPPNFKNNS